MNTTNAEIKPSEFIKMYSEIYDNQKYSFYKIFPKNIKYLSYFESLFFDELLNIIETNEDIISNRMNLNDPDINLSQEDSFTDLNNKSKKEQLDIKLKKHNIIFVDQTVITERKKHKDEINKNKEITNLLLPIEELLFKKKEFYDKNFHTLCVNTYKRILNCFIDKVETEILNGYKDINFISNVKLLYKFTIIKINIYNFLVNESIKYFCNTKEFVKEIKQIKEILNIKINDKNSYYPIDLILSPLLTGSDRIYKYNFNTFIEKLIRKIKEYSLTLNKEEAYLHLMNFTSELALSNLADNDIVEELKKYTTIVLD